MKIQETGDAIADVLRIKAECAQMWRDKPESYWLQRLKEEVAEVKGVLNKTHDDTVEHELIQISAIALNWLEMRYAQKKSQS